MTYQFDPNENKIIAEIGSAINRLRKENKKKLIKRNRLADVVAAQMLDEGIKPQHPHFSQLYVFKLNSTSI